MGSVMRKSAFENAQNVHSHHFGRCTYYHQSLFSTFIHSVVSNDSFTGHLRPSSDCTNAQADLGFRCPHMPEDTFSHGAAHIELIAPTHEILKFKFHYLLTSSSKHIVTSQA